MPLPGRGAAFVVPTCPAAVPLSSPAETVVATAAAIGTLAAAWAILRRSGRAAAATVVHIGLAHDQARCDDVLFDVLDRDSRQLEPRLRVINNRAHAADIQRREQQIDQQARATDALSRQVEQLGVSSSASTNRLAESMDGLGRAIERIGERLTDHGENIAHMRGRIDEWAGPEQRAAVQPPRPRSRGGQRHTDPA